jgi:hypothetical protein
VMALQENSTVKEIGLALDPYLELPVEDRGSLLSSAVAKMIRFNTSITHLDLANLESTFGFDSAAEIAVALKSNVSITDINLQSCFLLMNAYEETNMAAHIADLIASSKCNIQTLNLAHNLFRDTDLILIADALCSNQSITRIDVSSSGVCDKVIEAFVSSIEKNENIKSISLFDSFFDCHHSEMANQALLSHPQFECPGVPYLVAANLTSDANAGNL